MSSRTRVAAAFLAVYTIWGSTYLAIRFAVETLPPFLMAGVRYLAAGLLLFGWCRLRGQRETTPRQWRDAAIVGGLMMLGGNGVVCWAEKTVPSGLTALLVSTIPAWVVMLDWLWLHGARPGRRMFLGLLLGILGVAMLVRPGASTAAEGAPLLGAVAELAASALWAAGIVYTRRAARPASPLLAASMQMVTGGTFLLVAATLLGEWPALDVAHASTRSILSLLYLIVFGTLIGHTCFLWLIRATSPASASTNAFVNPVVAVILGWALAGEALGPRTATAAAVALTGVVLIVRPWRFRRLHA